MLLLCCHNNLPDAIQLSDSRSKKIKVLLWKCLLWKHVKAYVKLHVVWACKLLHVRFPSCPLNKYKKRICFILLCCSTVTVRAAILCSILVTVWVLKAWMLQESSSPACWGLTKHEGLRQPQTSVQEEQRTSYSEQAFIIRHLNRCCFNTLYNEKS